MRVSNENIKRFRETLTDLEKQAFDMLKSKKAKRKVIRAYVLYKEKSTKEV